MEKDILIIFSPGFAANEQDSTCIPALQQFVLQLKSLRPNLDIRIFSLHYPFNEGSYTWNGIRCYSFGGRNRSKPYSIYLLHKAKKCLREIILKNKVKAFLSIWMWDNALIGQQLMHETGVPHFCWMHGQDARQINHLVKKIQPKPEQVIAISDILQAEFKKNHGITAAHVVDNGITESMFPEFNTGERELDVLGVGSLTAHKNYRAFVQTMAELKKQFPGLKSMIIGEGEERGQIETLIKELGLQDNLVLKGSIPHKVALEYMAKSKVFLHTSSYEGSSGVIMEALYSGCQVVSTISVSLKPVKNVQLEKDPMSLAERVSILLQQKDLKREKVTFNTMRHSAEQIAKILNL